MKGSDSAPTIMSVDCGIAPIRTPRAGSLRSREEIVKLRHTLTPRPQACRCASAGSITTGARARFDFRSTVRHSLSYGGVPAEPKFRYPRPAKPEILVVADISGSVAAFARFTFQLLSTPSPASSRRSVPWCSSFGDRRGHPFFDGRGGHHQADPPDQHRSRRRVDRRPHRLRPRLRGVLGERWGRERAPRRPYPAPRRRRNNYHVAQAWVRP